MHALAIRNRHGGKTAKSSAKQRQRHRQLASNNSQRVNGENVGGELDGARQQEVDERVAAEVVGVERQAVVDEGVREPGDEEDERVLADGGRLHEVEQRGLLVRLHLQLELPLRLDLVLQFRDFPIDRRAAFAVDSGGLANRGLRLVHLAVRQLPSRRLRKRPPPRQKQEFRQRAS